ncbi:MAG: hypothetical protein IKL36_05850 [Clostridia bacterium]|nr:hypothetical protein [Clostridia bacterium]
MKRLISLALCCLILCSCGAKDEKFFDYQNTELSFDCVLVYNGHENEVKITMSAPNEKGERETVRVEYSSPEMIGGYTLEKSNGQYKGKMGDIEIPFGEKAAGVVKAIEKVFSLSEDMISSIETAENQMTEAAFVCEDITGKIIMNEKGELSAIEASFSDGTSVSLKIKE